VEGSGGFRVAALVAAVVVLSLVSGEALAGSAPDVNPDTVGCYMPGSENVWAFSPANTPGVQGTVNPWTVFGVNGTAYRAVAGKFGGGNVTGIAAYEVIDSGATGLWHALDDVTGGPDATQWYALPIEASVSATTPPVPLAGNWAGNGNPGVGLYYPDVGTFVIDTDNGNPTTVQPLLFGPVNAGDMVPIVGDFNGDGNDTVGVYERSTSIFYLTSSIANGAELANDDRYLNTFQFGAPNNGMIPIVGDWDLVGGDSVGLYDPLTSTVRLNNSNAAGPSDILATLGGVTQSCTPIAGNWNVSAAP